MPRLVLPRFYDGAAVLSEKIDAAIRQIASVLNGGLSADNLTDGILRLSAFAEPRGVYLLRLEKVNGALSLNNLLNDDIGPAKVYVPLASRVIAWGYMGSELTPTVRLAGPGGRTSTINGAADGAGDYSGRVTLAAPWEVAAGDVLTTSSIPSDFSSIFSAVVVLDAEHQE